MGSTKTDAITVPVKKKNRAINTEVQSQAVCTQTSNVINQTQANWQPQSLLPTIVNYLPLPLSMALPGHQHQPNIFQLGGLKGAWFIFSNPNGTAIWYNYNQQAQCFMTPEILSRLPTMDMLRNYCCPLSSNFQYGYCSNIHPEERPKMPYRKNIHKIKSLDVKKDNSDDIEEYYNDEHNGDKETNYRRKLTKKIPKKCKVNGIQSKRKRSSKSKEILSVKNVTNKYNEKEETDENVAKRVFTSKCPNSVEEIEIEKNKKIKKRLCEGKKPEKYELAGTQTTKELIKTGRKTEKKKIPVKQCSNSNSRSLNLTASKSEFNEKVHSEEVRQNDLIPSATVKTFSSDSDSYSDEVIQITFGVTNDNKFSTNESQNPLINFSKKNLDKFSSMTSRKLTPPLTPPSRRMSSPQLTDKLHFGKVGSSGIVAYPAINANIHSTHSEPPSNMQPIIEMPEEENNSITNEGWVCKIKHFLERMYRMMDVRDSNRCECFTKESNTSHIEDFCPCYNCEMKRKELSEPVISPNDCRMESIESDLNEKQNDNIYSYCKECLKENKNKHFSRGFQELLGNTEEMIINNGTLCKIVE